MNEIQVHDAPISCYLLAAQVPGDIGHAHE